MIIALLLFVAGALNAFMDTVHNVRYFKSIFGELPNKWKRWLFEPWAFVNKYKIVGISYDKSSVVYCNHTGRKKWLWGLINKPVLLTSAWHLAKSLMLVFISVAMALALVSENEKIILFVILNSFLNYNFWLYLFIYFLWLRAWFGLGFWLFYDNLLVKK